MNDLIPWFPPINASLNGLAGCCLIVGLIQIKQGKRAAHKRTMLTAFGISAVFLACYLTYHTLRQMADGVGHTTWDVPGWSKSVYLMVLLTHVIFAASVPVLAIMTIRYGLKGNDLKHKRLAKITWPIWMYVSVTGVVVYLMLYHLHPYLVAQQL